MMEVVIVDDGNRLTVYELVERVIPCIIAKHYSENYIQGFRSTFIRAMQRPSGAGPVRTLKKLSHPHATGITA